MSTMIKYSKIIIRKYPLGNRKKSAHGSCFIQLFCFYMKIEDSEKCNLTYIKGEITCNTVHFEITVDCLVYNQINHIFNMQTQVILYFKTTFTKKNITIFKYFLMDRDKIKIGYFLLI